MVTKVVAELKTQIGVSISASTWNAYKSLCSREKLRPAEGIEEFLKAVNNKGSILTVMSQIQERENDEGFKAQIRVLMEWWRIGDYWYHDNGKDKTVEGTLLQKLREIHDPQLRAEVEALLVKKRKENQKKHTNADPDSYRKAADALKSLVE